MFLRSAAVLAVVAALLFLTRDGASAQSSSARGRQAQSLSTLLQTSSLRGLKVEARYLQRMVINPVPQRGEPPIPVSRNEETAIVAVAAVDQTSPAAVAGLQAGDLIEDVILAGQDHEIDAGLTPEEFYRRAAQCRPDCLVMILYREDIRLGDKEGDQTNAYGFPLHRNPDHTVMTFVGGLAVLVHPNEERTILVGTAGSNFARVHLPVGLYVFKDLKTGHLIPETSMRSCCDEGVSFFRQKKGTRQ